MSHKRFHTVDAPTVPLNILECYDAAEYVLDELRALSTLVGLTFDEDHPFENLVAIRDAVRVVVDEHARVRSWIDNKRALTGMAGAGGGGGASSGVGGIDAGSGSWVAGSQQFPPVGAGGIDQYQHYLSHYDPRLTASNSGRK